jgi:hypothetical protein
MQDSIMMGEGVSSGRERAIETLVDSEPSGAHYRASRILVRMTVNRGDLINSSCCVTLICDETIIFLRPPFLSFRTYQMAS